MAIDLESPGGGSQDCARLYRARGGEVERHRPLFTGDVFADVPLTGSTETVKPRTVLIIQHPCAMRTNGYELVPRLLVAEVRQHRLLAAEEWTRFGKLMPLPDLFPDVEGRRRHQAAFFDQLHLTEARALTQRVACLSQFGVNLLLQRWVNHNSRVVVPTFQFNCATVGVFEESDLIEEWCFERAAEDVPAADATAECVHWLRQDGGGIMRQRMLEDDQARSSVRRQMRAALREPYRLPEVGKGA